MTQHGFAHSEAPNNTAIPLVKNIFGVSADFLGELKTWLEQNPPAIPVSQIVGYNQNTVKIYKKSTGSLTVANTLTETDVINEAIPTSSLGTTGMMRVTLVGDYLNNSGAGRSIDFKFYFGGTLLHTISSGGLNATSVRYPGSFECVIANLGATNSQMFTVNFPQFSAVAGTPATTPWEQTPADSAAIDTTVSQTFRVSVTHSFASASIDYTRRYYMIEFL